MPVLPILLALAGQARAADVLTYDPQVIAQNSTTFAQLSSHVAPAFERVETEVAQIGRALERLELGMALLGDQAPPTLRDWATTTRRLATGQYVRLQRHVNLLTEDVDGTFRHAIQRALRRMDGGDNASECTRGSGVGMGARLPVPGGSSGGMPCKGKDVTDALVAAIDKDPNLAMDVREILALPWPTVDLDAAPQPVVAALGTASWVQLGVLGQELLGARIEAHAATLERDLAALDLETKEGVAKGQALKDAYLARIAADGVAFREAVTAALGRAAKTGGPKDVGFCASDPVFGGCEGTDVTAQVLPLLRADRKLAKAIAGIR